MGADAAAAASREAAEAAFRAGGACDAAIGAGAACGGSCGDGGAAPNTASTILRVRDGADATSCLASHASLALSSFKRAAQANSVPWLHISAIDTNSEPHAGLSSR